VTPEEYQAEVAAAGARVALDAMERWRTVPRSDIATGWERRIPQVVENVTAAQTAVVQLADPYLVATVGGPVTAVIDPPSLAGAAADGRSLTTMLEQPRIRALTGIQQGLLPGTAMDQAMDQLAMLIRTTIADSARQAVAVAMTTHPHCTGYYRQLTLPSCARCAILAGRHYATNAGFLRHPKCDCVHIPVGDAGDGPQYSARRAILDGQVTGLSRDATEAIRLGASPASVVNARRGMSTLADGTQVTTEGTTRRGLASMRMRSAGQTVRPMPEQIIRDATSREDAIRRLYQYGYIV
jgi:hypothetical protein